MYYLVHPGCYWWVQGYEISGFSVLLIVWLPYTVHLLGVVTYNHNTIVALQLPPHKRAKSKSSRKMRDRNPVLPQVATELQNI